MAEDLDVKLVISAQNKAKSIINDLIGSFGGMGKGFAIAGAAATAATVAATAAGVAIAAAGIKAAMSFEKQLSSIKALTGATDQQMKATHDLALQLGSETAFSALEAAQGIEELLKAGVSLEDIMGGAAKGALDLAAAGGIAVADAATIASTALNAFRDDAISVTRAADILAGAANASAASVSELQLGLAQSSAVAAGVGLTFEDTASALALFANNGLKGSDAGTSLKTMLMNLQPVTDNQMALFRDLGIVTADGANQFFNAAGELKGMSEIAGTLRDALIDMTDQERAMALEVMFGSDAIRAGNILFKEGREGVSNLNAELNKFTAAEVAAERMDNLWGAIDRVKAAIETKLILSFENTMPSLTNLVDNIANFINNLDLSAEAFSRTMIEFDAKTGVLTFLGDSFSKIKRIIVDEFMPAIIKNKEELIFLAKIIGTVLIVALKILLELLAVVISALAKFLNVIGSMSDALNISVSDFVNFAVNATAAIDSFKEGIKSKFNELVTSAMEWGRHMLQNFADGIWQGIGNVGESLESAKQFIKDKIGFSKNPGIPTEVWGYHMMQNFAGGIDEGNEEVVDALDDAVAKAKERIDAFTETFVELKEKTKEAWGEFKSATKDAKQEYKKSIDEIKEKNKELKKSFQEDFANAVLDIRENIRGLQDELGASNTSFDQKIAEQFVDAENTIAESKQKISEEMKKVETDRDTEKIAELQANIAEQQSFLAKHSDLVKKFDADITEARRVQGLDEVERLMEQKAAEASILQTQIEQERATLNTHAETIQQYNDAITEQRRVRGLDELALLIENFEIEKSALQTQEEEALEIKSEALKKARKRYKKYLKNIAKDTKSVVKDMAAEFDKIPASMGSALEALSNRLINAGNKVGGKTVNNTTDNSKTFSVTVNAAGGEGQDDLLARLGVLLKTI